VSDFNDMTSKLSQVGLSVRCQENAKFEEVNPEDDKYYETYELEEGVTNNGEISLSMLSKVVTENKKFEMDA
jgi:hypothetical protein